MKESFATEITGHTLVGPDDDRPAKWGNCFDVAADGELYRIINFYVENLEHLIEYYPDKINFPVKIKILSEWIAIIHDERIPDIWYNHRYCETCTPDELLPFPQKMRHERQIMRGERTEGDGWVKIDTCKVPVLDGK